MFPISLIWSSDVWIIIIPLSKYFNLIATLLLLPFDGKWCAYGSHSHRLTAHNSVAHLGTVIGIKIRTVQNRIKLNQLVSLYSASSFKSFWLHHCIDTKYLNLKSMFQLLFCNIYKNDVNKQLKLFLFFQVLDCYSANLT